MRQSTLPARDASVARALADAGQIEASRKRVRSELLGRERTVTFALAAGFLASASACAVFIPADTSTSLATAVLFVAVYAAISQIEFEVGPGSAVPTTLVLVPMLLVLPVGLVPLAAAAGLLLGGVVERLRSRRHRDRAAVLLCSSWHTVGPALVVGLLAPGPPSWSRVPLYVVALLAQLAFDVAAVLIRHGIGRGVPVSELLPSFGWVVVVDGAFAPIGFVLAWAATDEPAAVLCALPLAGLLHVLSVERRKTIDDSLALGRAVEDASREARSDPLTGSGNRLAWQEAVADAALRLGQSGAGASVVFVDLDRLKETNDTYGHDAGDRMIQALSGALTAVAPENATVARIGGDEFAVLALGLDERGCQELARAIRRTLRILEIRGIPVSASLGASSCPPCTSLDQALRVADERLYADKAGGASGP